MFDIQILTYQKTAGKEETGFTGLFTAVPPHHAARGREKDQLVMLLTLEGGTLPAEIQQEMLEKMAGVYYKTRGTVTNALKIIVEQLNDRLLARNVRLQGKGSPILGIFNAVALHGSMVYFAHAGPTSAFLLANKAVEQFRDSTGMVRGLGISKAVYVRYFRGEVQPGDMVLLSAKPASSWNAKNLAGSPQLNLDQIRRRLLIEDPRDLRFIMLRLNRGKGIIQTAPLIPVEAPPVIQPEAEPGETATVEEISPEIPPEPANVPTAQIMEPIVEMPPPTHAETSPPPPVSIEEPPGFPPHLESEKLQVEEEQAPWETEPARVELPQQMDEADLIRSARRQQAERRARQTVSAALSGGRSMREKTSAFLRRFLPRLLPGQADKLPALSPALMVFIAIAVPLVIVAAASTAYIRSGRNEQHRAYLVQAQTLLEQANVQSDLTLKRVNMDAALEWITKAETYGVSEESTVLKEQAQSALDSLDGVRRVKLELALPGGFDTNVRITRMISSPAEDLFLLDANSGRVFRLVYTRPGYEVDNQFVCGPGVIGGLIIGTLVDIAAAPVGNNFNAAVIGVDEFGNILYCSTNPGNTIASTLPPPDAGWLTIKAISVDNSSMLVLDTGSNAVWRYEGFNAEYLNPPRFFFDSDVPNLTAGIDLFQNRDELYVLNQDGHMIQCTYSNIETTPTRCKDPYPFQITGLNQASQEVVTPVAHFERMQMTQPPEPSVYFLDSSGPAIYQFSLVMNFVSQLRPSPGSRETPQTAPTGFVVTSGRNLVVAFGSQIYSSPLPAP